MEVCQQLRLPRDATTPGKARGLIEHFQGQMARVAFDDLRLVITELTANCVQHGGRGDHMLVTARLFSGSVRVEVDCPGSHTRPRIVQPKQGGAGGLGLHIVDTLATRWGVHEANERTIVWAELNAS